MGTSSPPSPPPSPPRPEVMETPPLPRPPPSRISKRPSLLESSRDSMMDNHFEVARKMKAIEGMHHRLMIWKEDLVLCNPSNQFLRTPSRPSRRSLMSEE